MFFYSESEINQVAIPTSWSEIDKLTASDPEAYDYFGRSTSVSGDGSLIVVGAYTEDPSGLTDAGSVYVFQKSNGSWTQVQKLTAGDAEGGDLFGYSTSVSGDGSLIVVGAYTEDPSGVNAAGSVYVFQKSNGSWTQVQKLTAGDAEADDYFGQSTSVSGDGSLIVVGAYGEDPSGVNAAGSVYVFQKSNGSWTEVQKLTASDKEYGDLFGYSTSVSGDGSLIVVGAYSEDPSGVNAAGSVYVFQQSNGSWTQVDKLTAGDAEIGDRFGISTSVSGDGSLIVVGAYLEDPSGLSDAGSVYVFQQSNGSWTQVDKLTAGDKEANDYFGRSTSVSGDGFLIVVGAYTEDPSGLSDAGSVYVFQGS